MAGTEREGARRGEPCRSTKTNVCGATWWPGANRPSKHGVVLLSRNTRQSRLPHGTALPGHGWAPAACSHGRRDGHGSQRHEEAHWCVTEIGPRGHGRDRSGRGHRRSGTGEKWPPRSGCLPLQPGFQSQSQPHSLGAESAFELYKPVLRATLSVNNRVCGLRSGRRQRQPASHQGQQSRPPLHR